MTQLLTKTPDQRIVLQGDWQHFKLIQPRFEQARGVRLSYYQGTIELLTPGEDHATFSQVIGFLISSFLIDKDIAFKPTGNKTQEREGEVSAQADQSYWIERSKKISDLAIEVVFTSSDASKLAKYRALEVLEVWFWQDGTIAPYHLRSNGYEPIERSELPGLEELNFDLLKRCILIGEIDLGQALRVFRGDS